MALDDANKRLFVGCRLPARLVVLDPTSGRIVDTLPTVGDTDDVFYDADSADGLRRRWRGSSGNSPAA